MKRRVVALPGEETLIGSWTALTQLSPAARMINTSAVTAAVFPTWAPLNNAILQIAPDDRGAEDAVSQLTAFYAEAGVATWALWVRSGITNLDAPDAGPKIGGLQRDTTTLVMHATLSSGRQLQDGVVRTSIATATRAGDETGSPRRPRATRRCTRAHRMGHAARGRRRSRVHGASSTGATAGSTRSEHNQSGVATALPAP